MDLIYQTKTLVSQLDSFTAYFGLVNLRPYQVEAANAVIDSVFNRLGRSFVWKFARQGGKDETLTALYAYLMTVLCHRDSSIVVATPTFKPQTELSMQRLQSRLSHHVVLRSQWRRQSKHIFRLRDARVQFFSAHRTANVVGATASDLLVVNEAQDVSPLIYDKHFAPMAAANNATRLFSGTAWTNTTLLAREERFCRLQQERDGIRRLFTVDGNDIAKVHPPYGQFMDAELSRLGANNPIVVSQYLCREIDAQARMFTAARQALMQADSPSHASPVPGTPCAFLIDVAGQDETLLTSQELGNPGRDSTTLSIVDIDLSTVATLRSPTYRVIHRQSWTAIGHLQVFGQIKSLVEAWKPQHIVIDPTGVGEGLWALLDKSFPTRVLPVKFTQQEKSTIGWRFLAVIETGRFRDCAPTDEVRLQYDACQSEILPGPAKTLRWGVPDGSRSSDGQLIHDDYVVADSLVAKLDELEWRLHSETLIIPAPDPLDDMSHF